jgi:hypothetical protein
MVESVHVHAFIEVALWAYRMRKFIGGEQAIICHGLFL